MRGIVRRVRRGIVMAFADGRGVLRPRDNLADVAFQWPSSQSPKRLSVGDEVEFAVEVVGLERSIRIGADAFQVSDS